MYSMNSVAAGVPVAAAAAAVSRGPALQSRLDGKKVFVPGSSCLLPRPLAFRRMRRINTSSSNPEKVSSVTISAKGAGEFEDDNSAAGVPTSTSAASISIAAGGSMIVLLPNVESAQALSKQDVSDAYGKVEQIASQVTTTAGSAFDSAKDVFEKVYTTVKPGIDGAAPYVRQAADSVTKVVTPLASDLAGKAQTALSGAGVNTDQGVEIAKNAAQQTSNAIKGAQPFGSSALESALRAGPLFLAEAAGGLILLYFLAPSLGSAIANKARGYKGDLTCAQALDLLLKEDVSLVDIRGEKEKYKSGIPSLPSSAKSKYVAVPIEEFSGKIRGQLRNSGKVEAEVVAIKIAALKKLNKGSKVAIIDDSGGVAKTVAKALKRQGFKNIFVIIDGFKGGKGWVQSRLGTDDFSGPSPSLAEVLSPSRIIPAGTSNNNKRLGTTSSRFNLLPGGVVDE